MTTPDWKALNDRLIEALKPFAAPVAISFFAPGRAPLAPNDDGRIGQVPAGCVFWIHGSGSTFATKAPDHANCSVGSYTHGFLTLEEAATKDDVCTVLKSGWVTEAAVCSLPHIADKPETVVYGPLAESRFEPDVVLLRINALGLMTLKDAFPEMPVEGKPQCHIVAMAKNQQTIAASAGCALSRSRTGMRPEELTCVIPGARLADAVDTLEAAVRIDRAMARYASTDAKRFG